MSLDGRLTLAVKTPPLDERVFDSNWILHVGMAGGGVGGLFVQVLKDPLRFSTCAVITGKVLEVKVAISKTVSDRFIIACRVG